MIRARLIGLVALTLLAACGEEKTPTPNPATPGVPGSFTPLSPEEEGKVVARIGATTITTGDFERRLAAQTPFARARYASLERKREFLDSQVRFELLAQEAEAKGYDKDPDVVLTRKQAMVKRLIAQEVRNLVKLEDITDADAQAYYNEHKDEFDKPAQVRAAHLLVKTQAEADKLLAEINAKIGADKTKARDIFADFVRQHSVDAPTRELGGDLQFFGRPEDVKADRNPLQPVVQPAVLEAAFKLEGVGDLAPAPVQSPAGWHLVQKTGFRRAYKRELDDVKTSIRNKLFRQRKSEAMEKYVEGLRTRAEVKIDEEALAAIKVEAPSGPTLNLAPPTLPDLNDDGADELPEAP